MRSACVVGLATLLPLVSGASCRRGAPAPPRPARDAPALTLAVPLSTTIADSSLRGLDVGPNGQVWVTGTDSRIGSLRPPDALHVRQLPDDATLDLRDVQALDAATIVALAAGPGARSRVYRSEDGGASWRETLRNDDERGFYDALAFWDQARGILIGDPIDGRFPLMLTADGGRTWRRADATSRPPARAGEHLFAASGTCLTVAGARDVWFGTGGAVARVMRSRDGGVSWRAAEVPLARGVDSAGVFSLAVLDARRGVAVGGDYKAPQRRVGVAAWTEDGGASWTAVDPDASPGGYRSAVAFAPRGGDTPIALTVGTSGVDVSTDGGRRWRALELPRPMHHGELELHALAFTTSPDPPLSAWAAGSEGALLRLDLVANARP